MVGGYYSEDSYKPGRVEISNDSPQIQEFCGVERKGIGHPDTLSDHLAEHLSMVYSKHTLDKFGGILHHNFDKSGILGGKSKVEFGGGQMVSPIRVQINGRVSTSFGGLEIDFEELLTEAVHDFVKSRFGNLISDEMIDITFNISAASSPGHAKGNTKRGSVRNRWFQPQSLEDLPERMNPFANDTSAGVSHAPFDAIEEFVLGLEKHITGDFKSKNPWVGTDVKIMGLRIRENAEVTLCIPQISRFVSSLEHYKENIATCYQMLAEYAAEHYNGDVRFSLNTRDDYERQELYLTATGSSIESGDEGLVGRGNRPNGIISLTNPMSMEGASGKNPVYHIGKIYSAAANKLAHAVHEYFGTPNHVLLVSQSGRPLTDPWVTAVTTFSHVPPDLEELNNLVQTQLTDIPKLTDDFVRSGVRLA